MAWYSAASPSRRVHTYPCAHFLARESARFLFMVTLLCRRLGKGHPVCYLIRNTKSRVLVPVVYTFVPPWVHKVVTRILIVLLATLPVPGIIRIIPVHPWWNIKSLALVFISVRSYAEKSHFLLCFRQPLLHAHPLVLRGEGGHIILPILHCTVPPLSGCLLRSIL